VPTKTEFLWDENPLQNLYFPLSFRRINIKESQREAKPLLYNQFPFPLSRGRG